MLTQEEIKNLPIVVEFVSVPSTFDIDLVLSMRESMGIFESKETDLSHIRFITNTIKSSPYFVLSKIANKTASSCFLCLEIFRELGLTLESVSNQFDFSKFRGRDWKRHSRWEYKDVPFIIVVVNVYKFIEEGLLVPVIEKIVEFEDRVEEAEKAAEMLSK